MLLVYFHFVEHSYDSTMLGFGIRTTYHVNNEVIERIDQSDFQFHVESKDRRYRIFQSHKYLKDMPNICSMFQKILSIVLLKPK